MRKLAITLAVSMTFGLASAAGAALPANGPFAGKTSLHPINGFVDLVTFTSSSGGRMLKKFQFGTLGCFGTGAFPVGTDPYGDPSNLALIKSVPVSTSGVVSLIAAKPTIPGADGTVTTATINATFASAKSLNGTITVSQTDAQGDKCGPSKMKFTAVPGTPSSLGLSGP